MGTFLISLRDGNKPIVPPAKCVTSPSQFVWRTVGSAPQRRGQTSAARMLKALTIP